MPVLRWFDVPALSADELRELDHRASSVYGLPALVLMEHAGAGAAREIAARIRTWELAAPRIVVLCGPGNNGGDGAVVARWLDAEGHAVRVHYTCPAERLAGAAASEHAILARAGVPIAPPCPIEELERELAGAGVVVDALLGTGSSGPPRAPIDRWIETLERTRRPGRRVIALDVPSGLDADAGAVSGFPVRADLTLTFAARKLAFGRPESVQWTGEIVLLPIGAPRRAYEFGARAGPA